MSGIRLNRFKKIYENSRKLKNNYYELTSGVLQSTTTAVLKQRENRKIHY